MKNKLTLLTMFLGIVFLSFAQKIEFNAKIEYETKYWSNIKQVTNEDWRVAFLNSEKKFDIFFKDINFTDYNNNKHYSNFTKNKYHIFSNDKIWKSSSISPDSINKQYSNIEARLPYNNLVKKRTIDSVKLDSNYLGYPCFKLTEVHFLDTTISIYIDPSVYTSCYKVLLYSKFITPYYTYETKATSIAKGNFIEPYLAIETDSNYTFNFPLNYEESFYSLELDAWKNYLTNNLKANKANSYLFIPKGQKSAKSTILLEFVVDKKGEISNIIALNESFEPEKLVKEAIRVLKKSGTWIPAKVNGEPVVSFKKQPITFVVTEE